MAERVTEPRTACSHVRRKVGAGEDSGTVVESWKCDECGDYLLDSPPAPFPSVTEPEIPAAPRTHEHEWEPVRVGPESVGRICKCGHPETLFDVSRTEAAALAARPALDSEHPPCPAGCGCRLWTEDADVADCGCDGPCCWMDWDQYMEDVLDRPDYYREMMVASGRLAPQEPTPRGAEAAALAARPALDVERLQRCQSLMLLLKRFGRFNDAWWDRLADEYAAARLAPQEPTPEGER